MKEILFKYKSYAARILRIFENIYSWLPVASLIDDHIFVTHGGISDITDLEKINRIKRQKVRSCVSSSRSAMDVSRALLVRVHPKSELHRTRRGQSLSYESGVHGHAARMATAAGSTLERS